MVVLSDYVILQTILKDNINMYAIVEIAGQQFKVEKDQQIFVHRLDVKTGSKINFEKVLLLDDNGKIKIGQPDIDGARVEAKVIDHLKGDKVIVFRKKTTMHRGCFYIATLSKLFQIS